MSDIPNNTSTTAVLTGSGTYTSALEVNNDSDWWAVDLQAGKTYDFKISGDGSANSLGDGEIVIRDGLGNKISSTTTQNSPLSITPTSSGRYYIEVADSWSYDNAAEGNYVLTANMSDDILNNVATTRVISSTGTIASSLAQSNDSDWFKVSLKAGMTYGFIVTGDGSSFSLGDGRVVIRDGLGNEINSISDGNLLSFRATASGTYFVEVKDDWSYDNAAEGNYRLTSTLTDAIRSDVNTTGSILDGADIRGRVDTVQDSDWYKLNVVQGRHYSFTLKGDGSATSLGEQRVELRDANGNLIDYATSSNAATFNWTATTTGPVFVVAATPDYSKASGSFVLQVRSDSIKLVGGAGNDILTGGAQNNVIYGGDGNDRLDGAAGNDLLFGGNGNDVLVGGDGNDTFDGGGGDDYMVGGNGIDTAVFNTSAAIRVDLRNTSARQQTGMGNDQLIGFESVTSGSGADSLTGNAVANQLIANAGNDTLRGLEGNDSLDGGLGNDLVDGGAGVDTLVFRGTAAARVNLGTASAQVTGYGTDTLISIENAVGGSGADSLTGSSFGNRLEGMAGNDTLAGVDGNDSLLGGDGDDRLDGGNGHDLLVGGAGNDVLIGGAGSDTALYQGSAPVRVSLSTTAAQATGQGSDILIGIEHLTSGEGADTLTGNGSTNKLISNGGNDVVYGGGGNDIIMTGAGNDRLYGGAGGDQLYGGAGQDQFVFNLHDGSDQILDFEQGSDRIVIDSGATSFSQLTITQSGANAMIKFGDVTITVANTYYWQMDSSDFLFV